MRNDRLLPYETIVRAASSEPEAVNRVLRYYRRYIRSLMKTGGLSPAPITAWKP